MPKVTVLMPVYNGEKYLVEAVESILNQTFRDFEFIIINDGSTDSTREILESYHDPRIVLVQQENRGLIPTLNRGLSMARGEYVARQDCDDVSLPQRLEHQVRFLDANPDVALVGTHYFVMTPARVVRTVHRPPCADLHIRWTMLLGSPCAHPSVMFRRKAVQAVGGYDEGFIHAEDYELWSRLARQFKLANIPNPLIKWMDNPSGRQRTEQEILRGYLLRVVASNIAGVGRPNLAIQELAELAALHAHWYDELKLSETWRTFRNYATLYRAFCRHHREELAQQLKVLAGIRREYCQKLLGPAHYYCDLGQRVVAVRLMWQAVQAEPGVLVEPSAWRLVGKLLLGPRLTEAYRRLKPQRVL